MQNGKAASDRLCNNASGFQSSLPATCNLNSLSVVTRQYCNNKRRVQHRSKKIDNCSPRTFRTAGDNRDEISLSDSENRATIHQEDTRCSVHTPREALSLCLPESEISASRAQLPPRPWHHRHVLLPWTRKKRQTMHWFKRTYATLYL